MYLNTEDSRELITRNEVIICDWDNVIQNIDIPWLVGAYEQKEIFKDVFDLDKLDVTQKDYLFKVLGRKEYYLDKWLKKDSIEDIPQELKNKFMEIYIDDKDFYKKCKFTEFSKTLALLAEQKFCNEIIFLSHAPSEMNGVDKRKEEIFMEYKKQHNLMKNSKVDLVIIDAKEKKHEWVLKNKPEYTTAVDDRFDIIKGYIDSRKKDKGIFILPRLGYNSPMDRFLTDDDKFKFAAYANVIKYTNPF